MEQLAPFAAELSFFADENDRSQSIDLDGPSAVEAWLAGPNPSALRELFPATRCLHRQRSSAKSAVAGWSPPSRGAGVGDTKELRDGGGDDVVSDPYTLPELAADTFLPVEDLEEWAGDASRGKSNRRFSTALRAPARPSSHVSLARHLAGRRGRSSLVSSTVVLVRRTSSKGLRPADDAGQFRYEVRPGIFHDSVRLHVGDPMTRFVFIIDEINRADLVPCW